MLHRLSQRAAVRANTFFHLLSSKRGHRPSSWLARLTLLLLLAGGPLWPSLAHAAPSTECPPVQTQTVAAGGTFTVDLSSCSVFGLDGMPVPPSHGSVPNVDPANGNGTSLVTYVNDGLGALSDTFTVYDDLNGTIVFNVTVLPATSPLTVSPASVPTPVIGQSYSASLSATGGVAPYHFAVSGLPPGLSFNTNTISGTPTSTGPYVIAVSVTDSTTPTALTGNKNYSFSIANPVLVAAAPPAAGVNVPYSYQLAISGGTPPYSNYQLVAGHGLPAGLSLSSGGLITGTPTVIGTTTFQFTVFDSTSGIAPFFATVTAAITVNNLPPTTGPVSATVAYDSTNNPITLAISGATATSVAVATAATHGTAVASGTTIQYTPTTGYAGPDSFTYTATNAAGTSTPATVTITVSPPTITYAPANPASGTAAVAYSQSISSASGGAAPYTYAIATGSLPAGLTLAASGTLSGTPTAVGTFLFKVSATDSSTGTGPFSKTTATNLSLTIAAPNLNITPTTVPAGTVNTAYTAAITGTGGNGPYTYTLDSGALPSGVALSSTGSLSGTPTAAGSFTFAVRATDSTTGLGAPFSFVRNYTLNIAGPVIAVTPTTLSNGTVSAAYSQSLSASGGTAPYTFAVTSGVLPAGLNLDAAGTLSGTPTQAGDFNATVTATDAQSFTGGRAYTLHVNAIAPDAPTIGTATAGDAQATIAFTPPANNGGTPIIDYTVTSSPGGLTATSSGSPITVSGLSNGTAYTFTVTARNSVGPSVPSTASNSVTPRSPQTVTFNNPGSQNFGTAPTLTATASSGLPVTFSSTTTGVCTITGGGALTFLTAGTCSINADQSGNGTFLSASTVTQVFTVNAIASGAPIIGTATAGNAQATVTFTAPASSGGAPVISYTATSSPGGFTGTGGGSPITVSGLTNGTAYTFTVTANNGSATSGASAASNSVTPLGVQTITFANPGAQNFGTSPQLSASASSGLSVNFSSSTTNICTVTPSGLLSTVSPGTCTINADQTGNGTYLPAARVSQSFSIVVPGGAVTISTASLPAATGGVPYSQTIQATGGFQPYTFTLVGGALPSGLNLSAAGVLAGTPTVAGTFTITVRATDAATQTNDKNFQLIVNAPGVVITPSTVPSGTVSKAYSQSLSASGGTAPYTYAVTSGALPAGITLSSSGVISGTPTVAGSFNLTVTATDGFAFTGAQAYTLVVGQPAPIVVNDSVTTSANASATIAVTSNDTGPITSLTITQQPAHGTATVNGLNVVYTPTSNYFGSDAFKYTATGPGGTSAPATVSITVVAGAVPVVAAQSATVLAGKSITLHGSTGATNGPFSAATIVTPPTSGSVVVQGTDLVYTAAADASGTFGFDYTLSNPFGASKPAHVTLTVNPLPVAPTLGATTTAGTTVQVDLTANAHGGPFTGATLLSISPANAGSATIKASGNGYTLSFTAAPTFGGAAVLSYTLNNAYATSAPGKITVNVTLRSDPSKNAEVLGVLDAQADAARRMAIGQISNFQRRLESLHSGNAGGGFSNGITASSADSLRRPNVLADLNNDDQNGTMRYLVAPNAPSSPSPLMGPSGGSTTLGGFSIWTGGAVNFGKTQPGTSDNGIDFTTQGLSLGADKQVTERLAIGVGAGYGHDASDIGQHDSRSTVNSYNGAIYASFRPTESIYTDALLGYQWLSFDARRYVTDNGNTVFGSRDGEQWFGSFSVGYQHHTDDGILVTPYGRLDLARANLDAYTEHGDAIYSLAYQRQTVKTSTGTLGVLAQWSVTRDYGVWAPQLRAEFGHDMQGSSQASMRYADLLSGPLYQATLLNQSRNHTLLGAGMGLQTSQGWTFRAEYENYIDNTSRDNQSILLGVEKKFQP